MQNGRSPTHLRPPGAAICNNNIIMQNVPEEYRILIDNYHKEDFAVSNKVSEYNDCFERMNPPDFIEKCKGSFNDKVLSKVSYFYAGLAYEKMDDYDNAVSCFTKSYELDFKPVESLDKIARILFKNEQYEDAIKTYKLMLMNKCNTYDVWANIGISYIHLHKNVEAIAAFKRALELNPEHAVSYYNLGVALLNNGNLIEAKIILQKSIELDPDNDFYQQEYSRIFV